MELGNGLEHESEEQLREWGSSAWKEGGSGGTFLLCTIPAMRAEPGSGWPLLPGNK